MNTEPHELMTVLRLCDTGELREILERFKKQATDEEYELLAHIILTFEFKRTPSK